MACGGENKPVGEAGKNESVAQEETAAGINEAIQNHHDSQAATDNPISRSTSEELQKRLGALPIEKVHPPQASWAGPFTDEALNRKIERAPKDAQLPQLRAALNATGSAKVIIGLNIPFTPMGKVPESAEVAQVAAIAKAQNDILNALAGHSVQNVKTFSYIPYMAMSVDSAALDALMANPLVSVIEEDVAVPPTLLQSIPLIKADTAWNAGYTGAGQTVAILDTGVDKTHYMLDAGKVVSEACYSTTSSYPSTSVCPGGVNSVAPGSGVDCNAKLPDAPGACDHGTHVAGIAAGLDASRNGVAKNANVIAIQVFSRFEKATCGGTKPCVLSWSSDLILGLERVYALRSTYNIAAANMSLGGGRYYSNCDASQSSMKAAIDNLRSVGIATVISSGNSFYKDSMGAPACISTAVSVGATNDVSDTVDSYSNSASFLSLLAPGSWITSAVPGGGLGSNWSGTSMAAPHVAGAWAMKKQQSPSASVAEILSSLQSTGVSITDTNGIAKKRIKLDTASSPPPPVVPPRPDGSYPIYRFWSALHTHHFFTMSAQERDYIIATWPTVWSYEWVSYYAYRSQVAGTTPLYRFWSDPYQGHVFTSSEAERNYFRSLPHIWTHEEGIAYFVYNYQAPGSSAVYRFWSDLYKGYFYTISAAEKDYVIATWPNVWSYQGIVFYAMP